MIFSLDKLSVFRENQQKAFNEAIPLKVIAKCTPVTTMVVNKKSKELVSFLEDFRQKPPIQQLDEFVEEFLVIWDYIHSQAPNLSVSDIKPFSKEILNTITLPFFEKFNKLKFLQKYDAWIKEFHTLAIDWFGRGIIMFPLRLITFEVVNHKQNHLIYFMKKVQTGELRPTIHNLFNYLFPKLINVAIPLSELDLLILKAFQPLQDTAEDFLKGPRMEDYSTHLDASLRNIIRKLNSIRFYQIAIPVNFVDMAKLGYETYMVSHFDPLPSALTDYVLFSTNLTISNFSIIQIPNTKHDIYIKFQDDVKPTIFQQMTNRIMTWNMSGLGPGKGGWRIPPSFIHSDPKTQVISPSPSYSVSLLPEFDQFRKLTPADIKIIDFLIDKGSFLSKKSLSQTVGVSLPEVSRRMEEYHEKSLLRKIYQFFNIGLDLNVVFCVTCPNKHEIPWVDQFLSFPKIDLFYNCENDSGFYFGYLKLPPKWYKDFTRKIFRLKKEFTDLKFYYTVEPGEIVKWGIPLAKTYK
ncbi:MAG: hypothetical protein ACFE8U_08055 [Candidatus Hermodarchaeota archaeon]